MLTAVEPPVRIEVTGCEACAVAAGRWHVTFRVVNSGPSSVDVTDAWLPHGRFRGDGHVPLSASVPPEGFWYLTLGVTSYEEPGTVVENCFLILRAGASRVFARMRVEFDASGAARPVVEATTAQPLLE
jgi:hypothetical protein